MKQQMKYRNYYKCTLKEGICHGFEISDNAELQFGAHKGPCAYITRMFDTKDEDMTYHRLYVDCELTNVKLETIVAVTDDLDAVQENGVPLDKFLANPQVLPAQKEAALRKLKHVRNVNTTDMLLHELKGRYVWIYLAVYPAALDASCVIGGMRLEFPKYSFSEYFPEIYQENDFFERYLAVLQTIFLDEEKKVDEVPGMLDYEGTPDQYVEELAAWLGIDNKDGLFSPDQLRHMIRNIDLYQGGKGTKKALERMIRLVTGITPRIIEPFQWNTEDIPQHRLKTYKNLYGETKNHFCVILQVMNRNGRLGISEEKLERLIETYSMVGTQFKIVLLDKCSHTDGHCYLDVNSVLSTPEIASVDKVVLGSHITVG